MNNAVNDGRTSAIFMSDHAARARNRQSKSVDVSLASPDDERRNRPLSLGRLTVKKRVHLPLLFVGLACFLPASFAEPLTPHRAKDILQRIDEEGAKAVIGDSEERWGKLATQIQWGLEAGQEEWAEVARRLAPSSDAGSADDLQVIISRALPKSPRLVLGLVGSPPLSLSDVCGIPFDLEDDTAIKRQYLLAAEEALVRLDLRNEPDLEEKRKSCLQHLRSAKCYVFDCVKGRARDE